MAPTEGRVAKPERRLGKHQHVVQPTDHLWVSMFLNVHLSKRAHVTHAGDINCELVVEVDDVGCLVSQSETQNERRYERTQQFLHQKCLPNTHDTGHCFHCKYVRKQMRVLKHHKYQ